MTAITKDLMRAAKHLVQRGWAQGDKAVFDPDGGYCIATACIEACEAARIPGHQIHNDMVLLFKHANGIVMPVADWNDAPDRTEEDVLAAFDKAIEASAERADHPRKPRKPKKTPAGAENGGSA